MINTYLFVLSNHCLLYRQLLFFIGNLPPKYRSKLSSIQLLAIVKTNCLSTYGMDAVLHPIVEDLKKLVPPIYINHFIGCTEVNNRKLELILKLMEDSAHSLVH